jgi:1-acyl-sn-glycerol-3-phosphate acyltransferase
MQVDSIREKFASIEKTVEQHLVQPNSFDNILRRQLHADIELLRLDLEGIVSEPPTDEEQKIISDMDNLISKFPLLTLKRKFHWWKVFESTLRFVGAVCTMIVCAVYFSLIILVIRVFDEVMRVDPFSYYSQHMIMLIAKWFWLLAGVDVTIEGLDKEYFDSPCTILSFTHVSNFDGFFVAGTCPIRLMAFGKKELFIVPLFGWFSLAIGGMPVDRNNRERAIGALHHLSESAKNTRLAIAISPEGTRSTTGHLLPFKKGTLMFL